MVLDEMALTREWVLTISGSERPARDQAACSAGPCSCAVPYVDALSLLQLRALRGLRTGSDGGSAVDGDYAGRLQHLLLLTVNGVSAGLQNTG